MNKKGMLVILSAPSGCGKDTVFKALCKRRNDIVESVSATTRAPRDGEVDGVNYYFKTVGEFEKMIANNGLLEYAKYNNCYYGTPVDGVQSAVDAGKVCFLIIEVQGAQSIMKMCPDAVSIFLLPPSMEVLEHRLRKRETNSPDDIKNRIDIAESEIKIAPLYKYNVVNDSLEDAVDEINEIINKELEAQNA
ncbi:MAG TPA: guanylate kinase [Ruminococcaceae bacterium]|jgi:guanylate kinase|nr:MAG: guanylate kinase [Clostridiales bacterium 41_12_two_minus]HCK43492.1 guanylate kinase [Oscillospiraceae bacterium]